MTDEQFNSSSLIAAIYLRSIAQVIAGCPQPLSNDPILDEQSKTVEELYALADHLDRGSPGLDGEIYFLRNRLARVLGFE